VAHSAAPSAATVRRDLAGSPAPLAALHAQADAVLAGGVAGFRTQLRALRGYPVVVMQWNSACLPCQHDFPYFQQLSASLGRRVGFLGNGLNQSATAARRMLRRFPVSFPSFNDNGEHIATLLSRRWAYNYPITYFYNAKGVQVALFPGDFLSETDLRRLIRAELGV
jgi:cytochrome c biogenesis protein CcmG/thiol:disulfide interchange protein DsbE